MVRMSLRFWPIQRVFRFLLKVFFRKMTVVGEERLPQDGAVVLVANHVNSLLDPLILFCIAPRPVRFLAKAPLFKHPLVAPALKLLEALPVERRQDKGSDLSKNAATFEACETSLVKGDAIALFPEGLSHSEPMLQHVKTGAARIVGRATARGARVQLIPVGLVYTAKTIFRSEVTAVVGIPVAHDDLLWNDGEDRDAVNELTARIEEGLKSVTLNAERWEDLRFVQGLRPMAFELLGLPDDAVPEAKAEHGLLEKYYLARERSPEELALLLRRTRRYRHMLELLQLEDADVAREVELSSALVYTWKRLAWMVAGYPAALYGWLYNIVPYILTGPLALLMARKEDVVATLKLYLGLGLFLFFYGIETWLLWLFLGPVPALCAAALAVPAGMWSLRYYEKREEFFRLARAVITLRTRRQTASRINHLRTEVLTALAPLVEMYR
jgi:glycerol-3-phosphate O-acyltransferase/dihydroxyacetone phosphate acyltransferase